VVALPGTATVFDAERGSVICERCELADNPWRRLRGLLGRSTLPPGEGLLLRPAAAIHTCFMRFPIDAVFLDSDLRVIRIRERLRPWRAAAAPGARAVLELPADEGRRLGLEVGQRLSLAGAVAERIAAWGEGTGTGLHAITPAEPDFSGDQR
jgi:uncharacterized membrane protein (UPF0127 family)